MLAVRLQKKSAKFALCVGVALVVAGGIAGGVHLFTAPGGITEPRYSIDAGQIALSLADIGANQYTSFSGGGLGPTQMSFRPLPYQLQYYNGWLDDFFANSVLTPEAQAAIDDWETQRGFKPTHPPTIFGPYVAEHHGVFEMEDAEQSYHTVSAARQDYECCTFHFADNYDGWHTLPIQLGDEASAWTGIRDSPTQPGDDYEEQTFNIRWRHGPIISTMWLDGAHDITFDQDLALARIVDARIASAIGQPATSHATGSALKVPSAAAWVPGVLVGCAADRRARQRPGQGAGYASAWVSLGSMGSPYSS